MAVAGERTTKYTGAVLAARIVVDMADEIVNVEGGYANNESPLLVLSQKMGGKREVYNPEYDCLEDTYNVRTGVSASATVTHTSTSFTFALGS